MDERLVEGMGQEERDHVASWAMKTSRTEEWTGQQVARLVPAMIEALLVLEGVGEGPKTGRSQGAVVTSMVDDGEAWPDEAVVRKHVEDEFNHARLYARFATLFRDHAWCQRYASERRNFAQSGFTAIFRRLDEIPLACQPVIDESLVRFVTGLYFLDLAGLLAVGVYDESPFEYLRHVAVQVHADEGAHVKFGLEFLKHASGALGVDPIRQAANEFLPLIDAFFGDDVSPVQKTLAKVGIRKVPNADLKARFRAKVAAQLGLEG